MTDTNRQKMLQRILALKNKTTERGCTEAEALAAMELAARLIDEYGFSQLDLTNVEGDVEVMTEEAFVSEQHKDQVKRLVWCLTPLAEYYDCKAYMITKRIEKRGLIKVLVFFGKDSDAKTASYMLQVISTAMYSSWHEYAKVRDRSYEVGKARHDFERAFAQRIAQRLRIMKDERNAKHDPTGKHTGQELMVVKQQVVTEEFAKRFPNMRGSRFGNGRGAGDPNAQAAGRAAGDRFGFHAGVPGAAPARQIRGG